ncbi:unnamed protein product [Rangifer tarandus platyrhynchus]|uniref:Uncharacterized protein n=1 Tax=Rangifer tarandus platyrhynchus TaxID=3082113 RepID=A0AC59YDF8_RANTA
MLTGRSRLGCAGSPAHFDREGCRDGPHLLYARWASWRLRGVQTLPVTVWRVSVGQGAASRMWEAALGAKGRRPLRGGEPILRSSGERGFPRTWLGPRRPIGCFGTDCGGLFGLRLPASSLRL